MKKGINCWCFPNSYSIEECMKISHKAGFNGFEINMTEVQSENQHEKLITDELAFSENTALTLTSSEADILDLKELVNRINIEIPSISTSLLWRYSLTHNDIRIQEKGMDIVKKMIDAAKLLGANTILVVPGIVDENVSYKTAYFRALEVFHYLGDYAAKKEIHIGIENVWNKFLMSPLEMRNFIEKINSAYVGAYFDVGNVLSFSYPEYWIEILSDTIKKIHVKDFDTAVGNIHGFTNLLRGDVNWYRVMKALRDVSYDDYLTAELAPYRLFPERLAEDTFGALNEIIQYHGN